MIDVGYKLLVEVFDVSHGVYAVTLRKQLYYLPDTAPVTEGQLEGDGGCTKNRAHHPASALIPPSAPYTAFLLVHNIKFSLLIGCLGCQSSLRVPRCLFITKCGVCRLLFFKSKSDDQC